MNLIPAATVVADSVFRHRRNLACAKALRDPGNNSLLSRLAGLIDSEDIWVLPRVLNNDATDKVGEIVHVDGRDEVLALANDRKSLRVLDPRLLEVVIERSLSITVADTSAEYVHAELGLCVDGGHGSGLERLDVLEVCVRHAKVMILFLVVLGGLDFDIFFGTIFGTTSLALCVFLFFRGRLLLSGLTTFFSCRTFSFILIFLLFVELGRRVHPGHD